MGNSELEHKCEAVRDVVGAFPETSIETSVDPETGGYVFLLQVATAEQVLRLEIDPEWLAHNSEAEIRSKLAAYEILEKLRTSGGMAIEVDRRTCP